MSNIKLQCPNCKKVVNISAMQILGRCECGTPYISFNIYNFIPEWEDPKEDKVEAEGIYLELSSSRDLEVCPKCGGIKQSKKKCERCGYDEKDSATFHANPLALYKAYKFKSKEDLPEVLKGTATVENGICFIFYNNRNYKVLPNYWIVMTSKDLVVLTDEAFHDIFVSDLKYTRLLARKLAVIDESLIANLKSDEAQYYFLLERLLKDLSVNEVASLLHPDQVKGMLREGLKGLSSEEVYRAMLEGSIPKLGTQQLLNLMEDEERLFFKYGKIHMPNAKEYKTASGKVVRAVEFDCLGVVPMEFMQFIDRLDTNFIGTICSCGRKDEDHILFNGLVACPGDYLVVAADEGEPYTPYSQSVFNAKEFHELFVECDVPL